MLHLSSFLVRLRQGALAATCLMGLPGLASAQVAFTAGNYVVLRVGDGAATLGSAATAVSLLEYTSNGTLVQTIAVPATGTSAFTIGGSSGTEGFLTRSADGRYLLVPGYNAAAGTAAVAGTTSAATNRVVGRVASGGTFDTSTRLTDAFSGGNIRSAASANGSGIYAVGNSGGVVYVPFGNTGASTSVSTGSPTNDRMVGVFGGNLYVSSGSSPTYGVAQVGTGLPTASGQAQTLLPGFPTASTNSASSYAFLFTDQSATVPGLDVLYVADDGSATATAGIQKWSLVNNTWILNGTIGTAAGATAIAVRGLAGGVSGTTATLLATSATSLYAVTDQAGYNAAPSTATLPAAIATAGTNTAFRGVALAPLATALPTRAEASQQELALYPTPTQDVLTIRLPDGPAAGHQAEVRDLLGRVVQAGPLPATGQLRLSGLAPGTYLLTLDGKLTRRISKVE